MRYRLRTLLIVVVLGPPLLAPLLIRGWREYVVWRNWQMYGVGRYEKGYLGVAYANAEGGGVKVTLVRPGCAAEASGVIAGDVITAINNQPCNTENDLHAVLANSTVGTTLTLVVISDGQENTVRATLRKQPSNPWVAPARRLPATKSNP